MDYTSMTDQHLLKSLMTEITEEIRKLWDTLMGLEMELVDQLEVLNSNSVSFFRCKTLHKTVRRTNNECCSWSLPKCTNNQFSSLPGYCFLSFFSFFLISLTSSVFLSKIIIMNFHIDFLTELQARKGLIFLKSIFGL